MENISSESCEVFGNWKQCLIELCWASWKYDVAEETTVQNKALLQFATDKVCVIHILMEFVTHTLKSIGKAVKNWISEYILE